MEQPKSSFANLRNRYSRQTMLPFIGDQGQEKLGRGCAVIIGCGALGSNIATFLVRAGVGKVRIIDRDFVEYHNLQRQTLFNEDDVKSRLPKAVLAERHLKRVNSNINIEGIVADVNSTNIEKLCSGADVILDGLDNFESRFLINDVALKHNVPWIYGGVIWSEGVTMPILPGEAACLRCIMPDLPADGAMPTCETAGVINTIPAVIASMQATQALKILVGAPASQGLAIVDIWKSKFEVAKVKRRPGCPACLGQYDFLEKIPSLRVTSLCGQSRAMQVVDPSVSEISLGRLASRLRTLGDVDESDCLLRFGVDNYELLIFPDGRAIIKNTTSASLAEELYNRYIKQFV